MVERCHYDVWEAIVKSTLGGEIHWSATAHSVFWAERITILKSTGLSPYFMVHGVEPLFPFDLSEATFLVPVPDTDDITTPILITWRARQLQKHQEDIDTIRERVLLSRFASLRHFKQQFKNWICQQDFSPGDLVFVTFSSSFTLKPLNFLLNHDSSSLTLDLSPHFFDSSSLTLASSFHFFLIHPVSH